MIFNRTDKSSPDAFMILFTLHLLCLLEMITINKLTQKNSKSHLESSSHNLFVKSIHNHL